MLVLGLFVDLGSQESWHATCTILRRGCVGETHRWGAPPMIVGRANARMGNPAGEV
jgi:hypothetical protein